VTTDTLSLEEIKSQGDMILNRDQGFDVYEYGNGGVVGGVSSRGRQAWHGLLTVSQKPLLTIDDVRELYPQIFLQYRKEPLVHYGRPIPGKYAIVRSDGKPMSVVGSRYHLYAFEQVAEFGQTLLDTGEAMIETAVSTRNETAFFLVMKIPQEIKIAGLEHELIDLYLLLSNSIDASSKFRGVVTPVRSECTNTESLAIRTAPRSYELRHTASIEGRVLDARAALDITFAYTTALADLGQQLLGQKMRGSDFSAFLNRLVPLPPAGADVGDRLVTNRAAVRTAIRQIHDTSDTVTNIKGTRWGALQSVLEYRDHVAPRRKSATSSAEESRFNALVDPAESDIANRALALLT
jgi:phage/plasmid-like protein (TIGR03299 family)